MSGHRQGVYSTGVLAVGNGVLPSDYTPANDAIMDIKASGNVSMLRVLQNGSNPYIDIDTYLYMSGQTVRGLDESIISVANEGNYGDYAAPVSYVVSRITGGGDGVFGNMTVTGDMVIGDDPGTDTLDINSAVNFDGTVDINTTTQSTSIDSGSLIIKGGVGIARRLNVGENLTVHGNLTVLGNSTVTDVETFTFQDPLLIFGNGTTGDALDIGFLGKYDGPLNDDRYAGLFRDSSEATQSFILGFDIAHNPNVDNVISANVELADLRVGGMYVNDTLNVDGDVDADVSTFDVVASSAAATAISFQATAGGIVLDVDDSTQKMHFISGGNSSDSIDIDTAGGIDIDAVGKFDVDALDIELDSSGLVIIDAVTTLDMQSGGAMTIDAAGSSAISIGTDANTGTINVGTSATARTINIGNDASTIIDINAFNIQIDSGGVIEINATTTLFMQAGGEVRLDADGVSTLNIATDGAGSGDVNIATNDAARSIAIGHDSSTIIDLNALDIQVDSGGPIEINATTTLQMQSGGVMTIDADGASALNIATDAAGTGDVNIATSATARTINVGSGTTSLLNVAAETLTYNASNNVSWTSTVNDASDLSMSFTATNSGLGDVNFLVNVDGDVRVQGGSNEEVVFNDAGTLTHFRVEGTGSGSSNLIYAKADATDTSLGNVTYNGCVGIGKVPSGFRLDVEGSGQFSGYVTCPSDARLKINVEPLTNPLEKINQVSGVTYNWDIENFPERNFTNDVQVGFIAQEMEKVLPQIVLIDPKSGFRSIAYDRVTALLWEAVKAQQTQIKELQAHMNA
jgi:hypothetical protein